MSVLKPNSAYAVALRNFLIGYWTAMLQATGWKVSKAADLAGVDRTHLYRLLHKLGVLGKANQP